MKIGRRGFFGLSAGAVFGGPQLAEEFVRSGVPGYGDPQSASATKMIDGEWRHTRIAELRRLISGQQDDNGHAKWRRENAVDQRDRYRLDALRSISLQHKGHMLAEAEIRRETERRHQSWIEELFRLESGENA